MRVEHKYTHHKRNRINTQKQRNPQSKRSLTDPQKLANSIVEGTLFTEKHFEVKNAELIEEVKNKQNEEPTLILCRHASPEHGNSEHLN